MSERNSVILAALLMGIFFWGLVQISKPSHLGGCISLNLIKIQVNKSTLGSYCWTDDTGHYCLIRKDM